MSSAEEPASVSATGLCAGLAALGLAGAAASQGLAPSALGTLAGLLLFFVGGALGPVVRASPTEPSWLKLLCLSALLSPVLSGAVYVLARLALGAEGGVTASFLACALGSLAGVGRRVARPRLSRAGRLVVGLALVCGLFVAASLLRGSMARVSYHGLLHSALLLATDRSLPPTNPFLAGEPLSYYWCWHAQGALVARGLFLAPTTALALGNLWAAVVLPLALYFLVAPLARDGKGELLGVLLAVLGLNALGGWAWLARGAPLDAPGSSLEVLRTLGGAVAGIDPRLAFGMSKLGNLSSYPMALALLAGSWMAAAHGLRHGREPWVATTALLGGAAVLVNPIVGGLSVLVVGVSALLLARGLRGRILVPLVLAALPGVALALAAGARYGGTAVSVQLEPAAWLGALLPVVPLLVPALLARAPVGDGEDRRGRILGLLLVGAAVPLALAALVVLPYDNQYKLVRIAAVPLGLLAGKGLVDGWRAGGARRAVAALSGAVLLVGLPANQVLGWGAYLSFGGERAPLVERALFLGPDPDADPAGRAPLYARLSELARKDPSPVLLVDVTSPTPPRYGGYAFTRPSQNLQGHEAAPFTGLDLYCDLPSQALDGRTAALGPRLALVGRLFRGPGAMHPADRDALDGLGRPVVVLAPRADDDRVGVRAKLEQAGFVPLAGSDGRLLARPPAWARAVGEELP